MNTMLESTERRKPLGWLVFGLPTAVLLYSSVFLVPNWIPRLATNLLFFFYTLSVGVLVVALGVIALSTGASVLWLRVRRRSHSIVLHRMFMATCLALLVIAGVAALAQVILRGLPAGSHLLRFDSAAWVEPSAEQYVGGDITVRQKMLGDLVANVLPGRSRSEIETMLGPSLDTPYYRKIHRDLIYVLGPQRNSFFPIDSEWLLIWLDSEGRFARYGIYTD